MPAIIFFPLITAAVIAGIAAVWAFRQSIRGNNAFAGVMAALSWWLIAYTFELNSTTLPDALLWGKVQYLGIVLVPPLWLLFVLRYTNIDHRLARRIPQALFVLAFTTLTLVWTNERHGLIWADVALGSVGGVQVLEVRYGPWFLVHTLAAYTTIISANALLIHFAWHLASVYRLQSFLLISGALTPLFGNLIYLLRLGPISALDLTPFFFTITGALCAWGIYRARLLALVPVARNLVVDEMHDHVIVIDPQGAIADVNQSAQHLLGAPTRDLIGQPHARFAPLQALAHTLETVQREQKLVTTEIEAPFAGELRIFEVHLTPLAAAAERGRGILAVLRDVTERRNIERELRIQKDLFAGLVALARAGTERMQIGAALRNILHVTISLTQAGEGSIFLLSADGELEQAILVGGSVPKEQEPELAQRVLHEGLGHWVRTEKQVISIRDTQEDTRWLDLPAFQSAPVRSALAVPILIEARVIGIITLAHHTPAHFTTQHADLMAAAADQIALSVRNVQMYEAQRILAEQAEASSRAKSAFIATMSHELRTPLTAILGYTDIVALELGSTQHPELLYDLEQIKLSGNHLLDLVNTMLDLAQVASGLMPVEYQLVDPLALVQNAVAANQSLAEQNHNDVRIYAAATTGLITTDAIKLQQIVNQLLSNACKFTHNGQITVTIECTSGEATYAHHALETTPRYLLIQICDTGIGMSETALGQLFTTFMQADSSSTRRYGGIGVGLALSSQLAQLLGGEISAQSTPDIGSCFTLRLPCRAFAPVEGAPVAPPNAAGPSI